MIRHREPAPSPSDSRPDLYLAGMRCTQVRPPTLSEERLLGIFGYGGGTLGTLGGLFLIEIVRNPSFLGALGNGAFISVLTIASIIVIVFASTVAGPALRSLRRKRVFVFGGLVQRLGTFDTNQKCLFKDKPYPDEMVVLANRKTVLRSGARLMPLKEPSVVAGDRGPDTRKLSDAERQELRRLVRRYRRLDAAAWAPLLVVPLGSLFILPWFLSFERVVLLDIVILVGLLLFVFPRWSSWWAFSRRLARDLKDGVITSGNLWSGLPWLINGEPAPWRTARPEVGVLALNVDHLKSL